MIIPASAHSSEQAGWVYLVVLGGLVCIALIFYGLAQWDKKRSGSRGSGVATRAGAGMLELQSLLEPSKRHVVEAKKQKRKEDGAGDDEDTSGRDEP